MFNNIPTFAISLKRSSKRREYIKTHLKSKNIQYDLIDAVDGNTLTKKQIEKAVAITPYSMTLGIISCALSHIKVYKRMIDKNLPYALILEDDALVEDGFDADFLKAIPLNWDVLLLGYHIDNSEPVPPIPCSFWNRYKKDNFTIAKPVIPIYGTHGYIVSQQGAKKLLKLTCPLDRPIDHLTGNSHLINLFIFKKKPIIRVNYTYGHDTTLILTDIFEKYKNISINKKNSFSEINKVNFAKKMLVKYFNTFITMLKVFLP